MTGFDIWKELEIELWIRKHWATAPMLTRGMAEAVMAIERGYVPDVYACGGYREEN